MALQQLLNHKLDSSEFNNEELLDLLIIESVKKLDCIWNTDNPDYHKKFIVKDSWDIVANETNLPVDVVKNRWKRLRDKFRQRLKTAASKKKYEDVADDPSFVIWPMFPALKFLLTESTMQKWGPFVDQNDDMDGSFNISAFMADRTGKSEPDGNVSYEHERERRHSKRKRSADEVIEQNEENLAQFQKNAEESDIDADYLFLMSLLPSIKQLPDRNKMKLKIKIQKVIYEEISELPS